MTGLASIRFAGTVRRWFEDRGFGFIEHDDGTAATFVHVAHVERRQDLAVGARVTFALGFDRDGRSIAVDVRLEAD